VARSSKKAIESLLPLSSTKSCQPIGAASYKEEWIRQDFIDPLFEALGWDVTNKSGVPVGPHREVIPEDAIRVRGAPKAPDYGFYVGGARKFFVEAKKPSVNLAGDISPAFQLRRYAWSAKLPLSVLTDFEEMALYDCRFEPKKEDGPRTARLNFLTYEQYPERWEEIASIFSKEAVLSGSLEKYAEETKRKRGTETVDSGRLLSLLELFREADDRYNSGLFHFRHERGREERPDTLTPRLEVGDGLLRRIIRSLYYPDSPYEFSVLPVDVLGQVYEQFLGKVIRLTKGGHNAVVEEKPEVRKAGGVYYTPTYIVDYIVEHTVGKLLEGKRPGPRGGASKLKIVDPACGSGSLLIGAYQYLLDWHRDCYLEDGADDKWSKQLYQGPGGEWRLTIDEKKRILLNNIYGVDIDPQAVEVTKLSLLLKVLEGETDETPESRLRLFAERALPDLAANIKFGNSLIGPDFYEDEQTMLLDDEEHYRINVFDWKKSFPHVFDSDDPGFDAVIGNPPYIRIQAMKEFAPIEAEHYKKVFRTARKGNYDIYVVFVERGLDLLNKNGRLGYILPHKFFNAKYGAPLRELISEGKYLSEIIHFRDEQVFVGPTTYTCLMFLDRAGKKEFRFVKVDDLASWRVGGTAEEGKVPNIGVTAHDWNFAVGGGTALVQKLKMSSASLGDIAARIGQGIRTSANEVYVLDLISSNGDTIKAHSKLLGRDVDLEREAVSPFLQGREIRPYAIRASGKVVILPYRSRSKRAELIPEREMAKRFPKTLVYLRENKSYLENRERGRFRGRDWYMYGRQQNIDLMLLPKILVPDIANRASFALDHGGQYAFTSGYGITLKSDIKQTPKYIVGLLNSRVLDFYLKNVSTILRGAFFRYFTQFVKQLPIRTIDFSEPDDVTRHDRMVELVERMLSLHERSAAAKIEREKTIIQHQIDATDRQIDRLVYELYGLSDEVIAIIEEATVS
jgi:type I restriction-modification system DNA methylase subunit